MKKIFLSMILSVGVVGTIRASSVASKIAQRAIVYGCAGASAGLGGSAVFSYDIDDKKSATQNAQDFFKRWHENAALAVKYGAVIGVCAGAGAGVGAALAAAVIESETRA